MITGAHVIVHSTDADADRATIRLPGGGGLGLYQPRHERATEL
jgi:hypothetical protein